MERDLVERLLALAANQHQLLSVVQAHELGVTKSMLDGAVRDGWLHHERRGIYALAGSHGSKWQPVYAAVLATGSRAAISHSSAAVIHGFHGIVGDQPELIVPWGVTPRLTGVKVHRSRTLRPGDLDVRDSVAITTPIRTVVDLAGRLSDELLGAILDEGAGSGLWSAERVMARLVHLPPGTPGRARLVRATESRLGGR